MKPTLLEALIKNKTKILLIVVVVLALIGGMLLLQHWDLIQQAPDPSAQTDESGNYSGENVNRTLIFYDGKWYQLRSSVTSLLLIGLDKFEKDVQTGSYNNDQQADFLILIAFDQEKKTATAIHLNRDSMTDVPILDITGSVVDTRRMQLALAHTYGSGHGDSARNTVKAASALLYQTPINFYVTMTMDAVKIMNDRAGGVTLTIEDDLTSVDPSFAKGAEVTLNGDQALRYVRARQGLDEPTNLARMTRQRQYLDALYHASMAKADEDENFLVDTVLEIGDYLESDCSDDRLERFAKLLKSYEMKPIVSIEGTAVKGVKFMEFYPDEDALQQCLVEIFYEETKAD